MSQSHCERGFVVSVWVRNVHDGPVRWTAAWARSDYSAWLHDVGWHSYEPHLSRDEFRPRDPNRADDPPRDRPDLLEVA